MALGEEEERLMSGLDEFAEAYRQNAGHRRSFFKASYHARTLLRLKANFTLA